MNKVEKIKAEIERRKNQFVSQAEAFHKIGKEDKESYYAALASNMNSLSCFLDSLEEEPVSNDLEEAAIEAFKQIVDSDKNNFLEIFKAGAKWQKEKMLEDAVDGEIYFSLDYLQYRINTEPLAHLHHGD